MHNPEVGAEKNPARVRRKTNKEMCRCGHGQCLLGVEMYSMGHAQGQYRAEDKTDSQGPGYGQYPDFPATTQPHDAMNDGETKRCSAGADENQGPGPDRVLIEHR